jgi:hypothetical protein
MEAFELDLNVPGSSFGKLGLTDWSSSSSDMFIWSTRCDAGSIGLVVIGIGLCSRESPGRNLPGPAANKLFRAATIGMRDAGRGAVRFQRQVLKGRIVFDGLAKPGARVIARERFGLALVVRQNAVVSRIDRGVIEPRTNFRSLAVTEEVAGQNSFL